MSQKLDIEEIKDKIYQKLEPSGWARVLRTFIYSKDFENIVMQLAKQTQDGKRFTPPMKNWFRAFEECPYDELKVVIVTNIMIVMYHFLSRTIIILLIKRILK